MTESTFPPQRQRFRIRGGGAQADADLPEWWGPLDSDVEWRSLRFYGEGRNWLDEDELPEPLAAAGCRLAEIVAVTSYAGLAHPSLEVGRRVLLDPEPTSPPGSYAIAVWVEDRSQQIGYLPADVAAETMAEAQRRGSGFGAFVAREIRDKASHARRGLFVMLGPGVVSATALD